MHQLSASSPMAKGGTKGILGRRTAPSESLRTNRRLTRNSAKKKAQSGKICVSCFLLFRGRTELSQPYNSGLGEADFQVSDDDVPPPMILWGDLSGGELVLQWTTCLGASAYWVYGCANQAYFEPVPGNILAVLPANVTTWSSSSGIGDPDNNWTYMVLAVDDADQEIIRSNSYGEYDFGMPVP